MQSPDSQEIIFTGSSGAECEAFIRAIRKQAFAEGKQRDNDWVADLAAPCFDGPALRWYDGLDPAIQADWPLLRQALLARYPPDCGAAGVNATVPNAYIPTPAAAPPAPILARQSPRDTISTGIISDDVHVAASPPVLFTNGPASSHSEAELPADYRRLKSSQESLKSSSSGFKEAPPRAAEASRSPVESNPPYLPPINAPAFRGPSRPVVPRIGRIKVVIEGRESKTKYIRARLNQAGFHKCTNRTSDALHVQFIPSIGPQDFTLLNGSGSHIFLGITWELNSYHERFSLGPGSFMCADLAAVNATRSGSMKTSSAKVGSTRSTLWDVSSDGWISATWAHSDGVSYFLDMLFMEDWLYIAGHSKSYIARNGTHFERARFLFEPV